MRVIKIDPACPDSAAIAEAAALLRAGRLVAFPTETVYGLGANALDAQAVERIYAAKGRPHYNPLIVHVAGVDHVADVARSWDERADRLARAFWPGPLTLVLSKRAEVPDAVTAGLPTVAVRVPSHPVARALLEAARIPVAAPSANRSMQLSPTTGGHVEKSLGAAVDLILDAGPTTVGIESTVIDLSREHPTLLRPGTLSVPQIESVIGPLALATHTARDGEAQPSPGMMERHYSPRAKLKLVAASQLQASVDAERSQERRVGAVVMIGAPEPHAAHAVEHMPPDPAGYAARLYYALHQLDDAGCDVILAERVPADPAWLGVRDRLERASR